MTQSLESAALDIGIDCREIDLGCIDVWQRFPTLAKPRKNNGAIKLNADGTACLRNFETDEKAFWSPNAFRRERSDDERRERAEQLRRNLEARERHQRQQWADAAEVARLMWRRARRADPTHPYLVRKKLPPFDLQQVRAVNGIEGQWLIAPAFDRDLRCRNLECINETGDKRPIRGAQRKGLFGLVGLGMPTNDVIIGEGWATCAALAVSLNVCVVAAYGAGNLKSTAMLWRSMLRSASITIAADTDTAGMLAARAAAQAVGGTVNAPRFGRVGKGRTDWCDVFTAYGADVVRQWWRDE